MVFFEIQNMTIRLHPRDPDVPMFRLTYLYNKVKGFQIQPLNCRIPYRHLSHVN